MYIFKFRFHLYPDILYVDFNHKTILSIRNLFHKKMKVD